MYHNKRRWCVRQVNSVEELVDKLLGYIWCGCCGFEWAGYLWLNDSTSADSAQEYAVLRQPTDESADYIQMESVTVSWCDRQELHDIIAAIQDNGPQPAIADGPVVVTRSLADLYQTLGAIGQPVGWIVHPQLESPAEHHGCSHCV